jgi:hypothetical protein
MGAVEVVVQGDPPRGLDARIPGKSMLAMRVWIQGDALAGACSCSHGKAGRFCMHQVAAAIVWRQRLAGVEPQIDAQSRKMVLARARHDAEVRQRHARLRALLRCVDTTVLASRLLECPGQWLPNSSDGLDADALVDQLFSAARTYGLWHALYAWGEQFQAGPSTAADSQRQASAPPDARSD